MVRVLVFSVVVGGCGSSSPQQPPAATAPVAATAPTAAPTAASTPAPAAPTDQGVIGDIARSFTSVRADAAQLPACSEAVLNMRGSIQPATVDETALLHDPHADDWAWLAWSPFEGEPSILEKVARHQALTKAELAEPRLSLYVVYAATKREAPTGPGTGTFVGHGIVFDGNHLLPICAFALRVNGKDDPKRDFRALFAHALQGAELGRYAPGVTAP